MATIRKLRGRWQAQVRRRGIKPRAKSFDTKTEAERWARDLETQVDHFGAAPDTKILERTTLRDLLERYQLEVAPLKRGREQEHQRLSVLIRHDLAHRTLIGLSPADFAGYRDERLRSVSPATALREIAILSHVLEAAMRDWSYPIARNPVKAIRRPQVRNARERRLRGDEEARLHAACEELRSSWLKALLIVASDSGMRRGELLGLQWQDVCLDGRIASLAITKNGSARQVPLSSRAVEALHSIRNEAGDEDRVFPTSASSLEQTWRRLCAKAAPVRRRGLIGFPVKRRWAISPLRMIRPCPLIDRSISRKPTMPVT